MYVHPKLREMDSQFKALFDEVDHRLEDRWGGMFPLHPNRPRRGSTPNPESDGLFEAAADFTPGYGSDYGRGYIVALRVATLSRVPTEKKEAFMAEAADSIRELLPLYFPNRELSVVRDGPLYKIIGDFSLGNL